MGTRFHGWPEQAQDVLVRLEGEPSRRTRDAIRRDRERYVRQPMIDLLNDLADADPWYEDFSVWRYATTAYWWQNQCAVARIARHVEIGFRFSLDGLSVRAAWSYADPEQIASYRRAAAADDTGPALAGLLSGLAGDGCDITGDVMTRVPRGYPAGHPRAGLLRHRSLLVGRELDPGTARDPEPVHRVCERLRPLLTWLAANVAGDV